MVNHIVKYLSNLPGWHTKRKILVFESDDWGSIRMPSKGVYEYLNREGIKSRAGSTGRFHKYDALASEHDLSALFEVLNSKRDRNNSPLVFTAVGVVANPDFEKLKPLILMNISMSLLQKP